MKFSQMKFDSTFLVLSDFSFLILAVKKEIYSFINKCMKEKQTNVNEILWILLFWKILINYRCKEFDRSFLPPQVTDIHV